jgi:hypothetical protein
MRGRRSATVVNLLVDANLDGHAKLLDLCLQTDTWRELRGYLGLRFLRFEEVGLDRTAADTVVWRLCQERGFYLLTANRNQESEDSLEATIRREGTADSLPVLTFADAQRVYQSSAYRDRVAERLLDYLLNAALYRGAGRLFLP